MDGTRRFRSMPKTAYQPWHEENIPGTRLIQICSYAHLVRVYHNFGLPKTALLEMWEAIVTEHEDALRNLRIREAAPGEIAERVAELAKCRDAVNEIRNLPNE